MKDRVPPSPSRLIGRERELAELRTMLVEGARFVTLTGAGGAGKTRLALELAERSADDFASSSFVDLSGVRDPSLVPQTIASALAASRGTAGTPFETIVRHIGDDRVLLLLDNFEQLLPESAVVSDLLTACRSLVVIATSRAPLELRWERVYPVGPLEIPDATARSAAALRHVAAVALFCERARAVRPLFALDDATAPLVSAIVRRLDGMPLAIELAAARLRALSVGEVATRVDRALDLLSHGERDRPARQRTIRATIDWSLDLLSDRQRLLLRRMAVFEGGASLEAVEAVAEPEDGSVLDDLEGLVEAGVAMATDARGETRVRLPATVRERAAELLDNAGEREAICDRHARYFASFTARAECGLRGADGGSWYGRFEAEAENIRAALRHSLRPGAADHEPGMEIAARMIGPWYAQGAHEEALRWIDLALNVPSASPHRIEVLCNGGWFSHQAGELAQAERYYRTVIEFALHNGPQQKVLDANAELGRISRDRGDERAARAFYDEALRLLDELQIKDGEGRCPVEWAAGECLRWYGRAEDATRVIERTLGRSRAARAVQPTVACLTSLAELARARGDLSHAGRLLDEAWPIAEAMGHHVWQRNVLTARILLACDAGEPARAAELCWQSLRIARDSGDRTALAAHWIDSLAFAAIVLGQHGAAARLLGHADALREAIGAAVPPVERAARERALATTTAVLGDRADAAGGSEDPLLASLFAFAERVFAPAQPPAVALSRREREVAALVVRGLSNRAIADRLVLGERTVETHVERVLRKLDVSSRHSIAARAEELALTL